MLVFSVLYLLLGYLVKWGSPQEALIQDLSPKINFINIQSGSPTVTITFKSPTLDFQTPLTDFWLKIDVPFLTPSLGPPLWASTTTCCDFSTMPFNPTVESFGGSTGNYSTIYVKLVGATFSKTLTYVLQFKPNQWISTVGYTEFMKLSIVSENSTNAITYAYNYNFMNFYSSDVPSNNLLVQDDTVDPNRFKVNQQIDSYIIIQLGFSTAQRIVLQAKGDYTFATNADTTCAVVADSAKGIAGFSPPDVTCGFWESLGPSKKESLVYVWNSKYIPPGTYKLKFSLKTPPTSGNHHLTIMTMARYYPYIFLKKDYNFIFACNNDQWEPGYPQLFYSSNYNANNALFPDQVGLYSMGLNTHKSFNSLRFVLSANTNIGTLAAGETYTLEIYIGDVGAVLPLGYVYDNLVLAPGMTNKVTTFANGTLSFKNINFATNVKYTVSFRVGFIENKALPTDTVRGFGTCVLKKGSTVILKSSALMRSRFNVVNYNPGLMTTEAQERTDTNALKRRHRGFSAFRSAVSGSVVSPPDFLVSTSKNGLRIGGGQSLWFQSSMGPNPIYYLGKLVSSHNGGRMYLDVITDKSITFETSVAWTDANAYLNCDVYSRIYGESATLISKTNGQIAFNKGVAGTISTTSWAAVDKKNFIGSCIVSPQTLGLDTFTRLRMRFQDVAFLDTNNVQNYVRAKDIVLIDSNELQTPNGALGNYYIWNGIKVTKTQSFKYTRSDAVILDAFVLVYLFAAGEDATKAIPYPPEISMMDNMYVLVNDDTASGLPLSTTFYAEVQHTWMRNINTIPLRWSLLVHDSVKWPTMLNFYGSFNAQPTGVKYIMIFFDFFDVLVANNVTNEVGCFANGIVVQKCTLGQGYNVLTEQVYRTITNNAGYSYLTSRLNNYILLEMLSTDIAALGSSLKFSLSFPVKHFTGIPVDKLATLYENSIVINPVLVTADVDWNIIEQVEFGVGTRSMLVDTLAYSQTYQLTPYTLPIEKYEVASSKVKVLDDDGTGPANTQDNIMWVDRSGNSLYVPGTTSQFNIGKPDDSFLMYHCTTCKAYNAVTNRWQVYSGLICGNWDMAADPTFDVTVAGLDITHKWARVYYYSTYYGSMRYCLFLPSLAPSTSPVSNDANIMRVPLVKFSIPNYSGVTWPADTISVISYFKVLNYAKLQSLTRQFLPNDIVFQSGDDKLSLIQTYNSAKVTINFQITNRLPKGGVLFFGITAGCEAMMTIYGDNGTPPCTIRVDLVKGDGSGRVMNCIYSINTGGFQIELQEDLNVNGAIGDNNVQVIIYGLSLKKATASTVCNFILKTYLTLSKNPLLLTDKSTTNLEVTYTTPADPAAPSGTMTIVTASSDNNQVTAYSNVNYRVLISGRPIYQTDYLSMNLGALKYDTSDDPVWCVITDPTSGKYLPDFTQCITDNLGLVGIKAYKDLSYSEINVKISNVINPISKDPGVFSEYYINEGFQIFNSPSVSWSNLVNYEKFLNPVRVWIEFDVQGLRSDIFVSFIPDYAVNTTNVLYMYFSQHYLPILSKSKVYVSLKYFAPGARVESDWLSMKIWNISPRMLAITGWQSTIPVNSNITMRFIGIENPVTANHRVFQLILGFEKQYATFRQWGYTTLNPASSIYGISLININTLTYDSLIIRENTRITIGFSTVVPIPESSYLMVTFNYLGDEVVKKFKPFCFLTKTSEFVDSAERCYMIGNRLEARLIKPIVGGVSYTLIMDDIPNPDFGYREPEPIVMSIVSPNRLSVLSASTEMIINYNKEKFVKRDINQILDFAGIVDGVLEVPQGFYSVVKISPVVVDPSKETPYFLDETTLAMGETEVKGLVSKPLPILGINDFKGRIGSSEANLIVGALKSTVLTTYPVQITKKEASGKVYTELPLLRVKVIPVIFQLDGLSSVDVYIGGKSIPVRLSINNVPTSPIKFDILMLSGNLNGRINVVNLQQQFSLSEDQMSFFLQVEAYDTTIPPGTLDVTIRSVLASSNFLDKVVTLNLLLPPPVLPPLAVTITVPPISPNLYDVDVKAQSNQPTFLYFYAMPESTYSEQTKDTVRAWALNGLSIVPGDIAVGSVGIVTTGVDVTTTLSYLLADTAYKMVVFIESTMSNDVTTQTFSFSTKPLTSKNGLTALTLSSPSTYEARRKVLCIIARKYSMSLENVWSGDGLNCNSDLIPKSTIDFFKKFEAEPMSDAAKTQTSVMDIIAFQSKRKGENSQGLTSFYTATNAAGATNVFALFFNGVVRLTQIDPMHDFFQTKPTLVRSSNVNAEWNRCTISGMSFTGVKGFIFAGAQKAEEMQDSITFSDLRKLDKFSSSYWAPIPTSPSEVTVVLENLQPNTNYKVAIAATSDDPRPGAATSDIIIMTFKTALKDLANLLNISLATLLLLLGAYLN
jgi:hypothetical protein